MSNRIVSVIYAVIDTNVIVSALVAILETMSGSENHTP